MRPTHLLLPLLLLLVSGLGVGPSPKPAAAARHSRIELTTAAATPEAAASDNLAELQAVVMQPTVAAAAAAASALPASDETKRTDDGSSSGKASDPSIKNDQSSYVANAGGAGAGSSKLADGKYKQYLSGIAYPLRSRLTTSFLFPLTDANRGAAAAAAGVVVVAQQLKKEQKQQPEQDEEAGEGKEGLLSADYERISPATLASQQHHHNSIDECDPDLLGFEIITG